MEKQFIPYGKQLVDEEDIAAVAEVLRSPWLTTGPVVKHFEKALAEKVGARFCVVFNSGTAALHAAYHSAGVGPGDEVITTPITFAATANAALYLGAKPVFVDIAEGSMHIDTKKIKAAVSKRSKLITPVDMAGIPSDMELIMELAASCNLVVVEDACHALGAKYKSLPVGSIADMSVFSFHPVKQVTTGEGGAVTTNNPVYYRKLQIFRNHGIVREESSFEYTSLLEEEKGFWYYQQQELGYNYRLSDINCALGLSQLNRLDQFVQRRRDIANRYNEAFQENPSLILPESSAAGSSTSYECDPSWHLYVLRLAGKVPLRKKIVEKLYEEGIGTQVHYIPVYLHPYYQNLGYKKGLCYHAEDYYSRAFSIPLYPAMSDQDVERVISTVTSVVDLL